MFDFFCTDVADLVLQVCEIKMKHFTDFENGNNTKKQQFLDLKSIYGKMSTK